MGKSKFTSWEQVDAALAAADKAKRDAVQRRQDAARKERDACLRRLKEMDPSKSDIEAFMRRANARISKIR